jgi:thiol-disulfide isomerase/thioredoxin
MKQKSSYTFIMCTIVLNILFLAIPVMAQSTGNGYRIDIALKKSSMVSDSLQLQFSDENGVRVADKCAIQTDGDSLRAIFKGTIQKPTLAYLTNGDRHFSIPFIVEPGNITIREQLQGNYSVITAWGTQLNNRYVDYCNKTKKVCEPVEKEIEQLKQTPNLTDLERGQRYGDLLDKQQALIEQVTMETIAANSDNPLSALLFLCDNCTCDNQLEPTEKFWNAMSPEIQAIEQVTHLHDRVLAANTVKEGDSFIDIELKQGTTDGKPARFSDYIGHGKWVLVDFWASWCTACRLAIPKVKQAYETFKDKNFTCLSIAVWDKRPAALHAIAEEKMPWAQLIDTEGLSGQLYGFNAIPRLILFNPQGYIEKLDISAQNLQSTLGMIITGE